MLAIHRTLTSSSQLAICHRWLPRKICNERKNRWKKNITASALFTWTIVLFHYYYYHSKRLSTREPQKATVGIAAWRPIFYQPHFPAIHPARLIFVTLINTSVNPIKLQATNRVPERASATDTASRMMLCALYTIFHPCYTKTSLFCRSVIMRPLPEFFFFLKTELN